MEKSIVASERLMHLYHLIKSEKEAIKMKETYIDSLREEVMRLMGDNEVCYSRDVLDEPRILFQFVNYNGYYKLNQEELAEMAPLIYSSHLEFIEGSRRLRVL